MKTYRIPELAQKYVKYDMIQEHTALPDLANARIQLLFAFLSQQESLKKHSELYSLVVSLVQLGMDTHDLIDTHQEQRSEREMRSRQLKVLAGDYFSANFYQLLSQAGEIEMVSKISNAVSEINRLKVNLYVRMRQQKMTADDYLGLSIQLKSTLFQIFVDVFEGELARVWPMILDGISRCEVLIEEILRSDKPAEFDRSWSYWHIMQACTDAERQQLPGRMHEPAFIHSLKEKYKVHSQLMTKLKQSADSVKSIAGKLESDKLLGELTHIVDALLDEKTGFTPALN